MNKTLMTSYHSLTDLVDAMFPPIIAPQTITLGQGRRLGKCFADLPCALMFFTSLPVS